MVEVSVHEAKTHLSRLLARVAAGEEVVIAKSGRPVARIVPFGKAAGKRVLGKDRGKIWMAEDFDTLPPEIQRYFDGEGD